MNTGKRYTKQVKQQAIQLMKVGKMTNKQITKKFKLGPNTLGNWMVSKAYSAVDEEKKIDFVKQVMAGKDKKELEKQFKILPITGTGWMKKYSDQILEENQDTQIEALVPGIYDLKKQMGEQLLVEFDKYNAIIRDAQNKLDAIVQELNNLGVIK